MARHTIFIYPEIEVKIHDCITQLEANGAKGHELSFSGLCCKLIEMGLRMYQAQQNAGQDATEILDIERLLLESSVRNQVIVSEVLKLFLMLEEFKGAPFDAKALLTALSAKADAEVSALYGELDTVQ